MSHFIKFSISILIFQAFIGISGCQSGPGSGIEASVIDRYEGFTYSDEDRILNPDISSGNMEQLVRGNTEFALDFYKFTASDQDNLIFSPFSMSMAFAIAYAASDDQSEIEIQDIFHFDLQGDTLHSAFNNMDLLLRSLGGEADEDIGQPFTLSIANAYWVNQEVTVEPDFLDLMMKYYGTGVGTLTDEKAVNDWISDATEERITDVLQPGTIDMYTLAILVNAIYFKANWADEFSEDATIDDEFHLVDGGTVTAPFMRKTESVPYFEGDGFIAISLPYVGESTSMVFILPDEESFTDFESNMDSSLISSVLENQEWQEVEITIPKWDFESRFDLAEILPEMGMPTPFTPGVDAFPHMFEPFTLGEGNTRIDTAIHQANITVDEEGTEAAAVTVIEFVTESAIMEPPDPKVFRADHPFIFLIVEESTNTILFMGRVMDPSK